MIFPWLVHRSAASTVGKGNATTRIVCLYDSLIQSLVARKLQVKRNRKEAYGPTLPHRRRLRLGQNRERTQIGRNWIFVPWPKMTRWVRSSRQIFTTRSRFSVSFLSAYQGHCLLFVCDVAGRLSQVFDVFNLQWHTHSEQGTGVQYFDNFVAGWDESSLASDGSQLPHKPIKVVPFDVGHHIVKISVAWRWVWILFFYNVVQGIASAVRNWLRFLAPWGLPLLAASINYSLSNVFVERINVANGTNRF